MTESDAPLEDISVVARVFAGGVGFRNAGKLAKIPYEQDVVGFLGPIG